MGSSTDHSSTVSSEPHDAHSNRYASAEDPRGPYSRPQIVARSPSHRHSSNLSLDPPPINVAASVNAAEPSPQPDRPIDYRHSYSPDPQQKEKRSIRDRFGFGSSHHQSRQSVDRTQQAEQSSQPGLGRKASVRKDIPPGQYSPQASESQQPGPHTWTIRKTSNLSTTQLPTSTEEDESDVDHLDPFLQRNQQGAPSPAVPPKDPQYNQAYSPNTQQGQFAPPPQPTRVNTDQSYQNYGQDQYSPEQHVEQQQYQPYSQPQQLQGQQHPGQYQAFHPPPTNNQYPGQAPQVQQLSDVHAQQVYSQQQPQEYQQPIQQGRAPLQQQQVEYREIQPNRPPSQQQGYRQSPELQIPQQQTRVPVPQQQEPQHLQPINQQFQQQQQYAQPSPIAPQYQSYDPSSQEQTSSSPSQSTPPYPSPSPMPVTKSNHNKHGMPSGQSRDNINLQQHQGQQGQMQQGMQQTFGANVVPQGSQGQPYRGDGKGQRQESEHGRATPPPSGSRATDMTEDELHQLIKDHEVLREKYQKVKRYFFEQQNQVHQLQNTLAHQRLSLSRTSLDDSEYATRFARLDGLISQLSFAIRKNWKTIPGFLHPAVNKDAITTGKQEMTAVGRAFISWWLCEEIFEKYFHPDLETGLSSQLRTIQRNIRLTAPPFQSGEEEEALHMKIINWRLTTLDGLQDLLRNTQAPVNRQKLVDNLNEKLIGALQMHLQEPYPPDLGGGVPMIVELAVNNIAIHLPCESRDVCIEYFPPGHSLVPDLMKMESGIPQLTAPIDTGAGGLSPADAKDTASLKSMASDLKDSATTSSGGEPRDSSEGNGNGVRKEGEPPQPPPHGQQFPPPPKQEIKEAGKKRSMFGNLMGREPKPSAQQGRQLGAGSGSGSQVSLTQQVTQMQPPGSSGGPPKEEQPPRVRLAAGIAVSIRGRSVLMKAPVYST